MELRSNYAAVKDVQTKPSVEECVLSMGLRSSDAAVKDAQNTPRKEESA